MSDLGSGDARDSEPEPVEGDAAKLLRCVREAAAGDNAAASRAFEMLYPILRAKAQKLLANERASHTLQATALVNEAYVRLFSGTSVDAADVRQFHVLCAKVMRNVLTDHARATNRNKRGGGARRESLRDLPVDGPELEIDELIALDDAIRRFPRTEARALSALELKMFLGSTNAQVAIQLGVSERTVSEDLKFARAWLHKEMNRAGPD